MLNLIPSHPFYACPLKGPGMSQNPIADSSFSGVISLRLCSRTTAGFESFLNVQVVCEGTERTEAILKYAAFIFAAWESFFLSQRLKNLHFQTLMMKGRSVAKKKVSHTVAEIALLSVLGRGGGQLHLFSLQMEENLLILCNKCILIHNILHRSTSTTKLGLSFLHQIRKVISLWSWLCQLAQKIYALILICTAVFH